MPNARDHQAFMDLADIRRRKREERLTLKPVDPHVLKQLQDCYIRERQRMEAESDA